MLRWCSKLIKQINHEKNYFTLIFSFDAFSLENHKQLKFNSFKNPLLLLTFCIIHELNQCDKKLPIQ